MSQNFYLVSKPLVVGQLSSLGIFANNFASPALVSKPGSSGFPVGPKRARPHQEDPKEFSPFSEPISDESTFGHGVVMQ